MGWGQSCWPAGGLSGNAFSSLSSNYSFACPPLLSASLRTQLSELLLSVSDLAAGHCGTVTLAQLLTPSHTYMVCAMSLSPSSAAPGLRPAGASALPMHQHRCTCKAASAMPRLHFQSGAFGWPFWRSLMPFRDRCTDSLSWTGRRYDTTWHCMAIGRLRCLFSRVYRGLFLFRRGR